MEPAAQSHVSHLPMESDERLWKRSLGADGGAFGSLFDRHRERVFRHACRFVETRHDAEDVVGAAFLELWRRREKVRLVNGSVLPWLLTTTTNLARNSARGTRRYRQLLERLPRAQQQPGATEVAIDSLAFDVDPRLVTGLRSLSKNDAQLFALVALEGYAVGDAAELLELSLPAARTRLHRARARLRAELVIDVPPADANDEGGGR